MRKSLELQAEMGPVFDVTLDGEDGAPVEESILEVANGAFRPARRLRWHYRSRHSALIQFCYREIYDNGLVVFPAAAEARLMLCEAVGASFFGAIIGFGLGWPGALAQGCDRPD